MKTERQEKENNSNKAQKNKSLSNGMEIYFKCYPEETVFYITSDGQVFLQKNKNDALAHQKRLGSGEIETIKRE